jgi:hypothetical protein
LWYKPYLFHKRGNKIDYIKFIYTLYLKLTFCSFCRTKWKRQTAVGLELLAEAGNYAAVQRMLQTNPYWFTYHPQAAGIISNLDALYYRPQTESTLTQASQRPTLPRMFIHGLQQHVNHLPSPGMFGENRNWNCYVIKLHWYINSNLLYQKR